MIKSIKEWCNKPISKKVLFGFVIAIITIYLSEALVCKIYDSDMYFLISTGREILENGIPHKNVWTIDNTNGFIAQQWLYAIIIAIADRIGVIGFTLLVGVQFIILLFLLNHFFNLRNINKYTKILCIAVVVVCSQHYLFCLRPELITMILLLIECIALEHFQQDGKWKWLIALPLTMFAEINLHGSMWPIHFAILLAYLVPGFYLPGTIDVSICKQWKAIKPILVFTLLMTFSMLVNPYGLDGVLYIVKSFQADTFLYVNILEVRPPMFVSSCGLIIILGILFIFLTHKFQTLESTSLNIALGFITLNICASRHSMFTIFVMAYLLRCLGVSFKSSNVSIAKDIKNSFLFILILGVFYVGLSSFSSFYTMFIEKESNGLSEMCQYISKDYDEDSRIFTGFNNGAYFEWKGFKNIYMDARPELYTNDFTGDVDILGDYSKYCIYGYDVTLKSESNEYMFVTKKDMDDWFYSYDFDYVVVTPSVETYLSSYMTCNQAYKRVDSIGSSEYVLYEKIINTRN